MEELGARTAIIGSSVLFAVLHLANLAGGASPTYAALQGAAFAERAAHDPDIAAAMRSSTDEIAGLLEGLVRRAVAQDEVHPSLDPAVVVRGYLALADGLATQLLHTPRPQAQVQREAELLVGALLSGPASPSAR